MEFQEDLLRLAEENARDFSSAVGNLAREASGDYATCSGRPEIPVREGLLEFLLFVLFVAFA